MALVPLIEYEDAPPAVRAVYDDIKATRNVDWINNFWKALAHDPATLSRVWAEAKQVMAPGALDARTKEMIYVAVSVTNNCEYCIHSHTAAARAKGMTPQMFHELMAVVALANANNRLANGYRVDVDERFRSPLAPDPDDHPMPDNPATRGDVLFPEIEPYAAGRLPVDAVHTLYWETCGRSDGVPVVFLHGGPGGGCLPHHRRYFDPSFWRIVLSDQRGAGRSTPRGELARQYDAEPDRRPRTIAPASAHPALARLRRLVGLDAGSRLCRGPSRALPGLVLRGIFLARPSELDWFMHGMRNIFPEAWRAFAEFLPPRRARRSARQLLPTAHRPRSGGPSAGGARLGPLRRRLLDAAAGQRPDRRIRQRRAALAIARIEAHYFVHGAFLADDELLANLDRIRHLPCTIVQGRYDIVCPPVTAEALARAWPEAEYIVVPDAGHSVREPGITRELVAAVKRMQGRVG